MRKLCFLCIYFASSCSTNPQTPKHSKLNYLNGDHYENTGSTFNGIPLTLEIKKVETKIFGKICLYKEQIICQSLRFKKINLIQDSKIIATTFSNEKGEYVFQTMLSSGSYLIEVEKYKAKTIKIDKYNVNFNLELKDEDLLM